MQPGAPGMTGASARAVAVGSSRRRPVVVRVGVLGLVAGGLLGERSSGRRRRDPPRRRACRRRRCPASRGLVSERPTRTRCSGRRGQCRAASRQRSIRRRRARPRRRRAAAPGRASAGHRRPPRGPVPHRQLPDVDGRGRLPRRSRDDRARADGAAGTARAAMPGRPGPVPPGTGPGSRHAWRRLSRRSPREDPRARDDAQDDRDEHDHVDAGPPHPHCRVSSSRTIGLLRGLVLVAPQQAAVAEVREPLEAVEQRLGALARSRRAPPCSWSACAIAAPVIAEISASSSRALVATSCPTRPLATAAGRYARLGSPPAGGHRRSGRRRRWPAASARTASGAPARTRTRTGRR